MRRQREIFIALVSVMVGVLASPTPVAAQAPEVFEGTIVSVAAGAGGLSSIRLRIDEYTTDAEAQEFLGILKNQGWEALETAFVNEDKGLITGRNQRGGDIAFARSFTHETGRVIRVATARPLALFETYRNTSSREHAFGFIELRLDKEGKGSGIVVGAARLEFNDEGALEMESYGNTPLSITEISLRK